MDIVPNLEYILGLIIENDIITHLSQLIIRIYLHV